VTPWRPFVMLIPIGLVAALISWFGVSEFGPTAYAERHSLERQALADFIESPPQGPRELHFPGKGGPDPSIDISYARVEGGQYKDLKILVYNDLGLLASLSADTASIDYRRYSGTLVLTQCFEPRLIEFNPETGKPAGAPLVADKINELRVPFDFGSDTGPSAPKAMVTSELLQDIAKDVEQNSHQRGAAAELVRRVGLALAGLLLPLLGALLASLVNHPNRLLAIGVGVIPSALGYYPLMTAATTLAENGTIAPQVSMLVAPVATAIAAMLITAGLIRGRWV